MIIWQAVLIGGTALIAGFILGWVIRPNTDEVNQISADYYEAAYNTLAGQTGYQINPLTGKIEPIEK